MPDIGADVIGLGRVGEQQVTEADDDREMVLQLVQNRGPLLVDPRAPLQLVDPSINPQYNIIGRRSAFKTSTGVEVRFFMPVLNVPFRLIFYYDPQRGGVLDNSLQPQGAYGFRFAVGSTF